MYSTVHTAAGTAIVATAYKITGDVPEAMLVGGVLAFLSHKPVDLLGEFPYSNIWAGDWKTTAIWEGIPFIAFVLIFATSPLWLLFTVGMIAANGMDLIDKGWRLISGKPSFLTHNVLPQIYFTLAETKVLAVLSVPLVWAIVNWI